MATRRFRVDRNGRHDMKRLFVILLAVSGCAFQYQFVYKTSLDQDNISVSKRDLSNNFPPPTEKINNNDLLNNLTTTSIVKKILSIMQSLTGGDRNRTDSLQYSENQMMDNMKTAQHYMTDNNFENPKHDRSLFLDKDDLESKSISMSDISETNIENSEHTTSLELDQDNVLSLNNAVKEESNKDIDIILKEDYLEPANSGSQESFENKNHYLGVEYLNYRRGIGLHGPNGMAQDQQMFLAQPLPPNQPTNNMNNNEPAVVNNQYDSSSSQAIINMINKKTGGKLDANSVLEIAKKIIAQKKTFSQQPQESVNQGFEASEIYQSKETNSGQNDIPPINSNEERYMKESPGNSGSVDDLDAILQNSNNPTENIEASELESNAMLGVGFNVNQDIGNTFDFQNDDVNPPQNVMSAELDHLFGVGPGNLISESNPYDTGQVINVETNPIQKDGGEKELDALFSDQQNNVQSLENSNKAEEPHENIFEGGGDLDEIFGSNEIQSPNEMEQGNDGDVELSNIFGDTSNAVQTLGNENLAEVLLDNNIGGSNELNDVFGNNELGSPGETNQAPNNMIDRANENVGNNEGIQELDSIFNDNSGNLNFNSQGENDVPLSMIDRDKENIGNYEGDQELNALFNDKEEGSDSQSRISPNMIDRVQEHAINDEDNQELDAIFNDNMNLDGLQSNELNEAQFFYDNVQGDQSIEDISQNQEDSSQIMMDRVKENPINIQPDLELDAIFGNENNNPDDLQDDAVVQLLNGFEQDEIPEDNHLQQELQELFNSDDKDRHEDILDTNTFLQEYIGNGVDQEKDSVFDDQNEIGKINDGENAALFNSNEELDNLFSDNDQEKSGQSMNLNEKLETLEDTFFNSLSFDNNGDMGGPNPVNIDGDSSSRDLSLGRDLLGLSLSEGSVASWAADNGVKPESNIDMSTINHNDIDSLIFGSNTDNSKESSGVSEGENMNVVASENLSEKNNDEAQPLSPSEGSESQELLYNLQKLLLEDNGESQDSAINDLDAILNSDTKLNSDSLNQETEPQNLEQLLLSTQANSEDSALTDLEKLISDGSKQTINDPSLNNAAVSQDLEKLLFGDQETQDSALDELEKLMTDKTKQNLDSNAATNIVVSDSQPASQDLENLLFGEPQGEDVALSELDKLMSGGEKQSLSMGSPSNTLQNQKDQDLQSLLFSDQTNSDTALSELDKAMGAVPQKPPTPIQNQETQDLESLLFADQGPEGDSALMDLDNAMGTSAQKAPPSLSTHNQQAQDLQSLLFQDPGTDSALDALDNLVSLGKSKPQTPSAGESQKQNLNTLLFGDAGNDAALGELDGFLSNNKPSQFSSSGNENTENVENTSVFSSGMKVGAMPSKSSEDEGSGSNLPTLYEAYSEGGITSALKIGNKQFLLNEKPFRIISGSIHYFRVHPSYWRDRLQKLRAAGFNTVETLVPWALHEPTPKQVIFKSFYVDLRKFIMTAKEEDLLVILRPGPYVSAEFEFGGMPSWLLQNSVAKLRTPHPSFYLPAKQYLIRLSKLVIDLVWSTLNGAQPVIMVQVENDYTIYGASLIRDQKYIEGLKRVMLEAGLKDVMFTVCNAPRDITKSRIINGVTQTISYSGDPTYPLHVMNSVTPNAPVFFMEFKTGKVDIWGGDHDSTFNLTDFQRNFEYILSNGSSVNVYMFHGGTTPGFYTGGSSQHYDGIPKPIVNSYDYDAPLNEAGDYTSKYWALRKITQKYKIGPEVKLPSIPPTAKKTTFRAAPIRQYLTCTDLVNTLTKKYEQENLIFIEDIAADVGNVGFILYRKTGVTLASISLMKIMADVHDGFYVMVDGKYVEAETKPPEDSNIFNHLKEYQYALEGDDKGGHTIDILVENLGRGYRRIFHDQHKGMKGTISLDGTQLVNWVIYPMDFSIQWIQSLRSWKDLEMAAGPLPGPTFYRTSMMILRSQIADTYIDFTVQNNPWTKGVVFVNGYNLGRYWDIGPLRSLFLPAYAIKPGLNEFFIFELEQPGETIYFEIEAKYRFSS